MSRVLRLRRLVSISVAFTMACFLTSNCQADVGVGAKPVEGAEVVLDGSRAMLDEKWTYWEGPGFASSLPIKWQVVDDSVDGGSAVMSDDPVAAGGKYGSADIVTKQEYRDFRLHVEFFVAKPGGNSGVYLQNRYEIQVLDGDKTSHGMGAVINNTESPYYAYNGAGQWNAYDITFRAARFAGGKRMEMALASVYFNGQLVHENVPIPQVWGGANSGIDGGNDGGKGITDAPGGLKLQCEGHDVRYRNIWIKELDLKAPDTAFVEPLVTLSLLPAAEKPESIFNGEGLSGWQGDANRWSVVNGMIRGANADNVPSSTYLFTDKSFRNFRLIFDVKQTIGDGYSTMHSAVAVLGERISDAGDNVYGFKGPLLMFCHDWGIWDAHRRNRVVPGDSGARVERQGEWNQIEILVLGDRIRCAANGVQVFDFTDQPEMLQASPIGLQLHGNAEPQEYHFRGLVLSENPDDKLVTVRSPGKK